MAHVKLTCTSSVGQKLRLWWWFHVVHWLALVLARIVCGKMQTWSEAWMVGHSRSDSSVHFRLRKKYLTTLLCPYECWSKLFCWNHLKFCSLTQLPPDWNHIFYLFLAPVLSAREKHQGWPIIEHDWFLKATLGLWRRSHCLNWPLCSDGLFTVSFSPVCGPRTFTLLYLPFIYRPVWKKNMHLHSMQRSTYIGWRLPK